jgi:hypothetical protein
MVLYYHLYPLAVSVPQLLFSYIHPSKFVFKLHDIAQVSRKQQTVPDTISSTYMDASLVKCLITA